MWAKFFLQININSCVHRVSIPSWLIAIRSHHAFFIYHLLLVLIVQQFSIWTALIIKFALIAFGEVIWSRNNMRTKLVNVPEINHYEIHIRYICTSICSYVKYSLGHFFSRECPWYIICRILAVNVVFNFFFGMNW